MKKQEAREPLDARVVITATLPTPKDQCSPEQAALQIVLLQLDHAVKDFDEAEAILKSEPQSDNDEERQKWHQQSMLAWHQRNKATEDFTQAWEHLTQYGTIVYQHASKCHALRLDIPAIEGGKDDQK